jgi:hypothetical protein
VPRMGCSARRPTHGCSRRSERAVEPSTARCTDATTSECSAGAASGRAMSRASGVADGSRPPRMVRPTQLLGRCGLPRGPGCGAISALGASSPRPQAGPGDGVRIDARGDTHIRRTEPPVRRRGRSAAVLSPITVPQRDAKSAGRSRRTVVLAVIATLPRSRGTQRSCTGTSRAPVCAAVSFAPFSTADGYRVESCDVVRSPPSRGAHGGRRRRGRGDRRRTRARADRTSRSDMTTSG